MTPANLGMKLGFDKNGVYITFIVMTGNTHTMHGCFAIPKADAIAADGPSLANVQSFSELEIESFPATDLNPNKPRNAPEIILNREFGNASPKCICTSLHGPAITATISQAQIIPLSVRYEVSKRLFTEESGDSTRSGWQTTRRRGPTHDVRLRAWRQHLLV